MPEQYHSGFPGRSADPFPAEPLARETTDFLKTIKGHRELLRRPPRSVEEYLDGLARQGLPATVAALRPYRERL